MKEEKKELKLELLESGIVNRTIERMAEEKSEAIETRDIRLRKHERTNILLVVLMLATAAALTIWAFILTQPVELEVYHGMPEPKTESMNVLQTEGEMRIITAVIICVSALARIGSIRRHMKRRLAWKSHAEQRLHAETSLLLMRQRGQSDAPADIAAAADVREE